MSRLLCGFCAATAGVIAERYQGLVIQRWRCAAGHSGDVAIYGELIERTEEELIDDSRYHFRSEAWIARLMTLWNSEPRPSTDEIAREMGLKKDALWGTVARFRNIGYPFAVRNQKKLKVPL